MPVIYRRIIRVSVLFPVALQPVDVAFAATAAPPTKIDRRDRGTYTIVRERVSVSWPHEAEKPMVASGSHKKKLGLLPIEKLILLLERNFRGLCRFSSQGCLYDSESFRVIHISFWIPMKNILTERLPQGIVSRFYFKLFWQHQGTKNMGPQLVKPEYSPSFNSVHNPNIRVCPNIKPYAQQTRLFALYLDVIQGLKRRIWLENVKSPLAVLVPKRGFTVSMQIP